MGPRLCGPQYFLSHILSQYQQLSNGLPHVLASGVRQSIMFLLIVWLHSYACYFCSDFSFSFTQFYGYLLLDIAMLLIISNYASHSLQIERNLTIL